MGYDDGINWYVYVGNDPVNGSDPSGEFGVFGGAVGAGSELALELLTGELQKAVKQAQNGDYSGLERSAAKITTSGLVGFATGGLGKAALAAKSVAAKVVAGYAETAVQSVGGAINAEIDGKDPLGGCSSCGCWSYW